MQTRIMIDGMNLALDKGTGVSTYARNLSYELHNMGLGVDVLYGSRSYGGRDALLREIDFFDPVTEKSKLERILHQTTETARTFLWSSPKTIPRTGKVIAKTFSSRMPYADQLWNASNLFGAADAYFYLTGLRKPVRLAQPPEVMHWTYPLPLRMMGTKNIYTLHDLVPLRLPYTTLDPKKHYLKLMRRIVKRADHIVTVSETSRNDIIELLHCPEDKVTNTYQSVDIPAKLRNRPDDVVQREVEGTFGLPYKGYFLFFGSLEPKKNVGRLIEAYLSSKVESPLVIVGAQAWKSENELRLINDTTNRFLEQIGSLTVTRDRIRRFDYAPFPLLVSLIRGAKAVTFPSLYEGFGLPILEAMLLGTPVITSKESSTPEVAGDAALLVDPYDPRAISEAIIELDRNADLRAKLSAAGIKQAAHYAPEIYRDRLRDVYSKVLGRPV